jgi:hypothetical protein
MISLKTQSGLTNDILPGKSINLDYSRVEIVAFMNNSGSFKVLGK